MLGETTIQIEFGALTEVLLYILLLIYIAFSWILMYHWKNYGTDTKIYTLTSLLYFGATIPLFVLMFVTRMFI